MRTLVLGSLGALVAGCALVALFFLRFWRATPDRFFLWFAVAFGLLGLNWALLAATGPAFEHRPLIYLIRLAAFAAVLLAIADRNRSAAGESPRGSDPEAGRGRRGKRPVGGRLELCHSKRGFDESPPGTGGGPIRSAGRGDVGPGDVLPWSRPPGWPSGSRHRHARERGTVEPPRSRGGADGEEGEEWRWGEREREGRPTATAAGRPRRASRPTGS